MRSRLAIVVTGIALGLAMRMIHEPQSRTLLPPRKAESRSDRHGPTKSTGDNSEKSGEIEAGQ